MNVRQHWKNVRALGCCVTRDTLSVTIHHCHGGSVIDEWGRAENPGMGQKQKDWLVLPLKAEYHVGYYGIDNGLGAFSGVREWEAALGTQVEYLKQVRMRLGYNFFDMAGLPEPQ